MSRLQRLDFQGAIHLVRIRGRAGDCIFFDPAIVAPGALTHPIERPPALRHFEHLAWGIFDESGARVHGYVLEPDQALWVLQTFGAPLHAIMRRVSGGYSRYLHLQRRIPAGRPAFAARYESRIISFVYLPHAVRRVHRSPMRTGLVAHYGDYPFSSDRVYSGQETPVVPLETAGVQKLLARRRFPGVKGYRRFMDQEETRHVARLFDHGSSIDARIVGDRGYVASVGIMARRRRAVPPSEQLIQTVGGLIHMTPEQILATRAGVLGRALVAWYARRTGAAASLAQAGRWFSVSGATLGVAIRRYRADETYAPLFEQPLELFFGRDDRHT